MEATNSNQTQKPPMAQDGKICGFWRRAGAFAVDYIILNIAVGLIITILRSQIDAVMSAKAVLMLVLSVPYFAVCYSIQCDGQTLGMRALAVRVVAVSGRSLSLRRSAARAAVLCFPLCASLVTVYPQLGLSVLGTAIVILAAVCSAAIGYLAIFNRRNGRSLHDLVAGSVVVNAQANGQATDLDLARVHYALLPVICLLAAISAIMLASYMRPIVSLMASIQSVAGASPLGVSVTQVSGPNGTTNVAQIAMEMDGNPDPEKVARAVAHAAAAELFAMNVDVIVVRLQENTVDFYVGGSTHVLTASATPGAWQQDEAVQWVSGNEYRILLFTLGYLDNGGASSN